MAMKVQPVILGADVSKDWLDLHRQGEEDVTHIDNDQPAIDAFLSRYPTAALAVEATNTYHELLVDRARRAGWVVYLLSGYQLKHYAASIRQRARNDPIDARLIARYLAHEIEALRPYVPRSPKVQQLWQLLKRRALLVQSRQQLHQSLLGVPALMQAKRQLSSHYARVLLFIDRRLAVLTRELGWQADVQRLLTLPGVGQLTALALLIAYRAGTFIHHDPFIAFLGLDVRTKDSGYHKGQRKLTKHGDGEYRRLLYCAAMTAARLHPYFSDRYRTLTHRGLPTTAAYVVIARKLARLAFWLLRYQTCFDNNRLTRQAPQALA
jgi:transposase